MTIEPSPAHPITVTCEPPPGFAPGVGRYVAQLTEIREGLLASVSGLSPAQLGWYPAEDVESIGTQLLHIAAVEWSWIFQDILGYPDRSFEGWEEAFPIRAGASRVSGWPLAEYVARLQRVRDAILEELREFTGADLERLVGEAPVPESGSPRHEIYSIDWILFHLVHHEAHHAGQVELLVRLLPRALAEPA